MKQWMKKVEQEEKMMTKLHESQSLGTKVKIIKSYLGLKNEHSRVLRLNWTRIEVSKIKGDRKRPKLHGKKTSRGICKNWLQATIQEHA